MDICVVSTFWLLQITLLWYIEVAKRNLKTTTLDQNGGKWICVSMSKVRSRAETIIAFRLCGQYFLSVWLLALIFRRRKGGECSYGLGATVLCPEAPWSCREDWIQQLLSAHGSQSSLEMGRAECVSASLPHWLCGLGSFSCFSEPGVVVKIRWDDMCPVRRGSIRRPVPREQELLLHEVLPGMKKLIRQALACGSSQCILSRGTWCWLVPLLVVLAFISWLRWCLPGFSIAKLINEYFVLINKLVFKKHFVESTLRPCTYFVPHQTSTL